LIVAASGEALPLLDSATTRAVANLDVAPTSEFIFDRNTRFHPRGLARRVEQAVAELASLNAEALAAEYFYDNVFANTILTGFAWQRGLIPVSREAICEAIRLNGAAVKQNIDAFDLGRIAAAAPERLAAVAPPRTPPPERPLDELLADRAARLEAYQDAAYAARLTGAVEYVRVREERAGLGDRVSRAVATYGYKLMAYKDEYEVARLYTNGAWKSALREAFAGDLKIRFHLSPPLIAPKDPRTGRARKISFGPWMYWVFWGLAKLKGVRGSRFDPFGHTAERRMERRLRDAYLANARRLADGLTAQTHDLALKIASAPDQIRGFGHVKEAAVAKVAVEEARLWAAFEAACSHRAPAVEAAE
jgi:indolepyruvate ferredoxin oxidoreductase